MCGGAALHPMMVDETKLRLSRPVRSQPETHIHRFVSIESNDLSYHFDVCACDV